MKKIILILPIIMLVSCRMIDSREVTPLERIDELKRIYAKNLDDPFSETMLWLEDPTTGKKYPASEHKSSPAMMIFYFYKHPPKLFVLESDLLELGNLLDSNEPCAFTDIQASELGSPSTPSSKVFSSPPYHSTVGREAAFLMESFRTGKYAPYSDSGYVDIEAVKKWWKKYKRKISNK